MNNKKLFIEFTVLLYFIVAVHLLALYFFWYWSFWWMDIFVHFLGGMWVGGFALLLYIRATGSRFSRSSVFAYVIGLAAITIAGLSWELFEFGLDTFVIIQPNDIVDTASDLGSDIAGALTAVSYIQRTHA